MYCLLSRACLRSYDSVISTNTNEIACEIAIYHVGGVKDLVHVVELVYQIFIRFIYGPPNKFGVLL